MPRALTPPRGGAQHEWQSPTSTDDESKRKALESEVVRLRGEIESMRRGPVVSSLHLVYTVVTLGILVLIFTIVILTR